MNNFKRFGKGIQIEPIAGGDPASGRKGEITWPLALDTLRVNIGPTYWRNLLLKAGVSDASSLTWDQTLGDWKENETVKNSTYSLYGKPNTVADSAAAADFTVQASSKTAGTGNGGNLLLKAGDSVGGVQGQVKFEATLIDAGVNRIANVVDPLLAQDAATKNYVDDVASKAGARKILGGGTLSSSLISSIVSATLAGQPDDVALPGTTGDGRAQTFLATESGTLSSIVVELSGNNPSNYYNIDIYKTLAGAPDGSPIATSDDFDAGTLTGSLAPATFTFTSGPVLLAGTTYALHIRAKSGSTLAGNVSNGGMDVAQVEDFDFTGLTGSSFDVGIGGSPGLYFNLAGSLGYVWFNVQDGLTQTDPLGVGVSIQVNINLADNATAIALAAKTAIDTFAIVGATTTTFGLLEVNYLPGAIAPNGDAGTSSVAFSLITAGAAGVDAYPDGAAFSVSTGPVFSPTVTEDMNFIVNVSNLVEVSLTSDMYLETKGLDYVDNTILSTEVIPLPADKYVAYVIPNLVSGGPTLTPIASALPDVPANAVIIARREGNDAIVGSTTLRLKTGQTSKMYQQSSDQTLAFIGATDTATSSPTYSSNNYVPNGTSLRGAVGLLDTGLSTVAANVRWKAPVANFAALPLIGNTDGDVRLTLDNNTPYRWNTSLTAWKPISASGGGTKIIGGGTISYTGGATGPVAIYRVYDRSSNIGIISTSFYYAQSFTASYTAPLNSIKVYFSKLLTPNASVVCDIYSDAAGFPGTLLGSSTNTINTSSIATSPSVTAFTFNFSGINLSSGSVYYFVPRPFAAVVLDGSNRIQLQGSSSAEYSGGSRYDTSNGGASWTATPSSDLAGIIYQSVVGQTAGDEFAVSSTSQGITAPTWIAQSFLATVSYTADTVGAILHRGGATLSGNYKIYLYATSGGAPTGSPIASTANLNAATLPATASGMQTFPLTAPVALVAGTTYAIAFQDVSTTGGSVQIQRTTSSTIYPDGDRYSSPDGATWSGPFTGDYTFTVYQTNSTTPQLSFSSPMYLEQKGLAYADNTIPTSQSPITLSNSLDVAYVVPNTSAGGPNLTVTVGSLSTVPTNAVIVARRDGSNVIVGSSSMLMKAGQTSEFYAQASDQMLAFMGATDTKTSSPTYASNNYVPNGTSLRGAIGMLDTSLATIAASSAAAGSTGAVQFKSGTAFAADSTNFFWDNTNKRLGLGTATPSSYLYIKGNTSQHINVEQTSSSLSTILSLANSAGGVTAYFGLETSSGTGIFGSGAPYQLTIGTNNSTRIGLHVSGGTTPKLAITTAALISDVSVTFNPVAARSIAISQKTTTLTQGDDLTVQAGAGNRGTAGAGQFGGSLILRAGQSTQGASAAAFQNGASILFQTTAGANGQAAGDALEPYITFLGITPTTFNRANITMGNEAVDYVKFWLADSSSGGQLMQFRSPGFSSPVTISGTNRAVSAGAGPLFTIVAGDALTTGVGGGLTLGAGTAAGTDQSGGTLTLKSGIATGNGNSIINFQTVVANQGTGTTQRTPATSAGINSSGIFFSNYGIHPGSSNALDLGAASNHWRSIYGRLFICNTAPSFFGTDFNSGLIANFQSGESSGAAATGNAIFRSGDQLTGGTGVVGSVTLRSGNTPTGNSNPTGLVTVKSGDAVGSGATGNLDIRSGNSASAASGDILLTIGTGATQGKFKFIKSGGTVTPGHVWTAISSDGEGYWAAGGGGGGTPAGATGAIQFNNAGSFAADTANLFWDDTNDRLGIGTNAPATPLHIQRNGAAMKIRMQEVGLGPNYLAVTNSGGDYTHFWGAANSSGTGLLGSGIAFALEIGTGGNQPIMFHTNGDTTARFQIFNTSLVATVPHRAPTGSGAAPSYTFSGDATTGFHQAGGAGTIGVGVSGSNRFNFNTTAFYGGADNTYSIGTTAVGFANMYTRNLNLGFGTVQYGSIQSASSNSLSLPSGSGAAILFKTLSAGHSLGVATQDGTTSGSTYIESGNASAGNSGNIYIQTGTATGTRGSVVVNADALNVQAARFTITGEVGSNLPSQFPTLTLGTLTAYWGNVFSTKFTGDSGGVARLELDSTTSQTLPSGTVVNSALKRNYIDSADRSLGIYTESSSVATAVASGSLLFETGNRTGSSTGDSGDIVFKNGTSVGGQRGKVIVDTRQLDVTNVTEGVAMATWHKYTVSESAFTAAAANEDVQLFSLPAKGFIEKVIIKHSTSFTGGGIATFTLSVGVSGNLTKYASAFDVFQAPGSSIKQSSSSFDVEDFSSATSVRLAAVSTGGNVADATAGSVDVYVLWGILP